MQRKDFTYSLYVLDTALKKDMSIPDDGSLEIIVDDDTCVKNAGIVCYGTFFDYGADISCEIDSVDGVRNMKEN